MPTVGLDPMLNDSSIPNPCTHSWVLQFAFQIERAKLQEKEKKMSAVCGHHAPRSRHRELPLPKYFLSWL